MPRRVTVRPGAPIGTGTGGGAEDLRRLPKLELHVHLEGTIPPPLLRSIGKRNGTLRGAAAESILESIYAPSRDLPGFLRRFQLLTDCLRRPVDFHDAARRYAAELNRQGVIYAEVHLSAPVYMRRGMPLTALLEAIDAAFADARRESGIDLRLILDGVRQWGPESLLSLVRAAEGTRRYGVVGIGMGGDEGSIPAGAFREAFRAARDRGWSTTVHAGEAAPAGSVRAALETLEVDRIEHGIRAAAVPDLLDLLAARGTCLDLCPTSNLRTGAVPAADPYPIRPFLEREVPVSIGTDDPALFGIDLAGELRFLRDECRLTGEEIERLQENALRAAFLGPAERRALAGRLRSKPRGSGVRNETGD